MKVFQIFYSAETRAQLDAAFTPLDNSAHEHPDWYEYWPIRKYFTTQGIVDQDYYGFLSPRFTGKTRLSGQTVLEFVAGSGDADVVTFSPYPCMGAVFLSVFEHGEYFHPGLVEAATELLAATGDETDLNAVITHSRNTIFSNYFVAKGWFWRKWLELLNRLFELTEHRSSAAQKLSKDVRYIRGDSDRGYQPMKVFVMERIPSLLVVKTPGIRVANHSPFQMPVSREAFRNRMRDLIRLDSLKLAYLATGDPAYMGLFQLDRDALLRDVGLFASPT